MGLVWGWGLGLGRTTSAPEGDSSEMNPTEDPGNNMDPSCGARAMRLKQVPNLTVGSKVASTSHRVSCAAFQEKRKVPTSSATARVPLTTLAIPARDVFFVRA